MVDSSARRWAIFGVVLIGLMGSGNACNSDLVADDGIEAAAPQQGGARRRSGRGVYKSTVRVTWFDAGNHLWYRNELPGGRREYILVDAVKGERRLAFDHAKLAAALEGNGVKAGPADRLSLDAVEFDIKANHVQFRVGRQSWACDLTSTMLTKVEPGKESGSRDTFAIHPADAPRSSSRNGPETEIYFVNKTKHDVELFWLESNGSRRSYGKLAAGAERSQHTFAGHVWLVLDNDRPLVAFVAEEGADSAVITGTAIPRRARSTQRPNRSGGVRRDRSGNSNQSPDGKWRAEIREGDIYLLSNGGSDAVQLSHDGEEDQAYQMIHWSPDSQNLIAFRVEPGEEKEVYRVESSPKGEGRAQLHTRNYALPGDKFTAYELNVFSVGEQKKTTVDLDRIDFGRPRIRFRDDGKHFTFEQTDRGHQRFRLIEVDVESGESRTIIDEKSETFVWRAHTQNLGVRPVTWLDQSEEIIFLSERDGWRHIYLIDPNSGESKNEVSTKQITKGEFVVRGIDRIDEEKRQIWFRASGVNSGQDPYLLHHYRINFDGSQLVALTDGHGTHSIEYSPDRRFIVDSYSRVDRPPSHELRRVSDGKLMCELERADVSELEASGWKSAEVFSAKGRDGATDIWGIICRPRDFDPEKTYPIIEDIYAGPHDSFVPKSFNASDRYSSLTELGFIVVKIDGMGTANRSKAFHDVCWKNLKDGGFLDRIAWIKAAAEKYPYMDSDRVGIYGTSAGGQNSTAAVLFHPEFYKAAYSACGCHDNRMDKASWNEQWMGYPVGPHYAASSNIDNAHRLRGHLMLMVGEMDNNVPPESTFRLVDALIKADKDFDLIVMPGVGHSNGGAYGQRRMRDFFVRHLLNAGK